MPATWRLTRVPSPLYAKFIFIIARLWVTRKKQKRNAWWRLAFLSRIVCKMLDGARNASVYPLSIRWQSAVSTTENRLSLFFVE